MEPMCLKILVVDDETAARRGLVSLLSGWGYDVEEAADGQEALEKAVAVLPSVVLTDLVMPRLDGHALLKSLRDEVPFAAVILLTGQGTIETAVAAMKDGAYDYLTKPVDVARLKLLIPKAASSSEAVREVALLRRQLRQVMGVGRIVGTGPAMQALYRMIEMAAPTPAPVLITGESGTGKELVARTIHELSPRARAPFVAVNCAAIPETLLESEIFGHEKGAFTGALERRAGCFELAHQGTLFLDEIAEMNPATQAKFLRVLEGGAVRRLGGRAEVKMDVRVLAATNKDPQKALRDGSFREDLYYRLNVVSLALPPLREHREDIPLLIEAFIGVQREIRQAHRWRRRRRGDGAPGRAVARERPRAQELPGARGHRLQRAAHRPRAPVRAARARGPGHRVRVSSWRPGSGPPGRLREPAGRADRDEPRGS